MQEGGSPRSAPQRRGRLRALVIVNALLLLVLGAVTFAPDASAQARGRGAYTMVAGGVAGGDAAVVYIIDAQNQEMIAVTYNPNNKNLEGVGYRSLRGDAASVLGPRAVP